MTVRVKRESEQGREGGGRGRQTDRESYRETGLMEASLSSM